MINVLPSVLLLLLVLLSLRVLLQPAALVAGHSQCVRCHCFVVVVLLLLLLLLLLFVVAHPCVFLFVLSVSLSLSLRRYVLRVRVAAHLLFRVRAPLAPNFPGSRGLDEIVASHGRVGVQRGGAVDARKAARTRQGRHKGPQLGWT